MVADEYGMAQCGDHAVGRCTRPELPVGQRSLVLFDVGGVAERSR
jgi:hypothetical protein